MHLIHWENTSRQYARLAYLSLCRHLAVNIWNIISKQTSQQTTMTHALISWEQVNNLRLQWSSTFSNLIDQIKIAKFFMTIAISIQFYRNKLKMANVKNSQNDCIWSLCKTQISDSEINSPKQVAIWSGFSIFNL